MTNTPLPRRHSMWASTLLAALTLSLSQSLAMTLSALPQATRAHHLTSLPEMDHLSNSSTNSTRKGNVDVLEEDGIGLCRLDYMVGLSAMSPQGRIPTNRYTGVQGAAAVALAVQHLNTGNGSIVPEVEGLNERCNLRFTFQGRDSYWNQKLAVDQLIDWTTSPTLKERPCAILGAVFSRVTMSTAMISSLKGYLQMGYSTATELEDRMLFPLATRIVPSLSKNCQVMIRYIREVLGVKHLAVLHTDTRESQSYSVALQQAAALLAPDMHLLSFDIPDQITPSILQQVVTKLKETKYTFFLGAVKAGHLPSLWNETVHQGIAGTGKHTWILPIGDGYFQSLGALPRDSPQALAIPGIHMVRLDGFQAHPVYNRLAEALKQLGNSTDDRSYILSKLPTYPDVIAQNRSNIFGPILLQNPTFLQSPPRNGLATWAYDSAIAAGLAACKASAIVNPNTTNYFDGPAHFQALTQTTFQGATGNISFDPTTGTRQNPRYRVVNVLEDPGERSNATHVAFQEVTTGLYVDDQYQFLLHPTFNDGTTNLPLDLPSVQLDENHLSAALRATCLTMSALIVCLAAMASVWVIAKQDHRVVRSAQPIFLHILFLGVAIIGAAIVPLSIGDENENNCNAACVSFPWLLSIGFSLTFSALWAKTHRVNKLLQTTSFRRITVSPLDVAKPMLLVLCANVFVLSLWTALHPLHCEREIMVWDEFERPIESRGFCTSDHSIGYLVALAIINLGPLVFAVYEAYKARNISTEYAETDYILKALIVICLVCFIGIPVLIIAYDNPAAYFFVSSAILFVMSMSILVLIFGPKLQAYYQWQFCTTNKSLPLRFSRTRSFRGSSSMLALGSQASVSELSQTSGLLILSHPKTEASLQQENKVLQARNEELKKELEALQNEPSKTERSFHEDSHRTAEEEAQNVIRKLQDENGVLRKRILQLEKGDEEKESAPPF